MKDFDFDMDALVAQESARQRKAMALAAADPKLPYISALVIAGDLLAAERSLEWLREGKYPWRQAEAFCGSYGRLDLRVRAYAEGLITDAEVIEDLPAAWRSADPDDTDPRFLALWQQAFIANGRRYLFDGKQLPKKATFPIYRGQDHGAPFGIAWSLDPEVAMKFADGAATRQRGRGGVIYCAIAHRLDVMGYMTKRNEAEVIVDPVMLRDIEVWR